MDPNPKKFPVLSYVLSRFHPSANPNPAAPEFDIERPDPAASSSSPRWSVDQAELMERMPRLSNPRLLAAMAQAITDVAQTRSILRTLGERPDHEAVDAARVRVAEIDASLARELEDLVRAPRPEGADRGEWRAQLAEREKECRARAEREKCAFRAVVQLDDMHEAYEKLLREAEERLVNIYGSDGEGEAGKQPAFQAEEEVNTEVINILKGAADKSIQRVELSGRQLRVLPEAFGKIHGLLVLDLSHNQLESLPDSIAGLEYLEELRLSSNVLVHLPDSIGRLLNLKILDVSGNKLKALPDSIAKCRSLVELDASYNELTYLPTSIGYELLNLQKLFIHLNKIRSLPTSVCEMRSLRHLDAHFNAIHGLPQAFGKLRNLEILNLSSNFSDLTELPSTFCDLINLKELDLSNNQIHTLPDTFGHLLNLIKLNLDQNPLVIPPIEVAKKGAQAVKEFMSKRLQDILQEEEQKALEAEKVAQSGWLTRSTSLLSTWASGVAGYLGGGSNSFKDSYLDQQL